jgi:hypothetical protein
MSRLPEGRREVQPSRRVAGKRQAPALGSSLNVSVPISIGLPLVIVGLVLVVAAIQTDRTVFWILGSAITVAGTLAFASGKRL